MIPLPFSIILLAFWFKVNGNNEWLLELAKACKTKQILQKNHATPSVVDRKSPAAPREMAFNRQNVKQGLVFGHGHGRQHLCRHL